MLAVLSPPKRQGIEQTVLLQARWWPHLSGPLPAPFSITYSTEISEGWIRFSVKGLSSEVMKNWSLIFLVVSQQELSALGFPPTLNRSFGTKTPTGMNALWSGLTWGMERLAGKRIFLYKCHMFPGIIDLKFLLHFSSSIFDVSQANSNPA